MSWEKDRCHRHDTLRDNISIIPKEGKDFTLCQNYRAHLIIERRLEIIHENTRMQVGRTPTQPSPFRPGWFCENKRGTRQRYKILKYNRSGVK